MPFITSFRRRMVSSREPMAFGNSAFMACPGGLIAAMGRKIPALNGMVLSWVQMNVTRRRVKPAHMRPMEG